MAKDSALPLDDKAWLLLQALQADARAPLKALADAAGLSLPATAERIKRLQEAGVVRGYQAQVDPAAVGYGVRAIVGIHVPQPGKRALLDKLASLPEANRQLREGITLEDLHKLARALTDVQAAEELNEARAALFRRVPARTG